MLTFVAAVAVASFLGSLHCVGMCGPFALLATAGRSKPLTLAAYHAGRLATYLSAGLAAGVIGSAITVGGNLHGLQSLAARLAGGLLVLAGAIQWLRWLGWLGRSAGGEGKGWTIAGWIHKLRPIVAGRSVTGRAFLIGLLTTWLPCGWLYLFVLVAAGTGEIGSALMVMLAFWIGSLPALTGMALGAGSLAPRLGRWLPVAASGLLIVTGLYTATGRAAADLSSMSAPDLQPSRGADAILDLPGQPLPCCEDGI